MKDYGFLVQITQDNKCRNFLYSTLWSKQIDKTYTFLPTITNSYSKYDPDLEAYPSSNCDFYK